MRSQNINSATIQELLQKGDLLEGGKRLIYCSLSTSAVPDAEVGCKSSHPFHT